MEYATTVILKCWPALGPHGGLVKTQIPGLYPQGSDSVGLPCGSAVRPESLHFQVSR